MGPAVAEQTHWRHHADALVRQQALQVIDAADRLLRKLGDGCRGSAVRRERRGLSAVISVTSTPPVLPR